MRASDPPVMEVVPSGAIVDDLRPHVGVEGHDAFVTLGCVGQDLGGAAPEEPERAAVEDVRAGADRVERGRRQGLIGGAVTLEAKLQLGRVFDDGPSGGLVAALGEPQVDAVGDQVIPDLLAVGVGRDPAEEGTGDAEPGGGDRHVHRAAARHRVGHQVDERFAAADDHEAPPAISMLTPVRYEASSESRNATVAATSSRLPYRRSGT